MKLTSHLPGDRRAHVEGRLRANLMAWLTTVRPDGRPDSVPVWFLLRTTRPSSSTVRQRR
jgi:predicted pyridoxine 5'-phosphate oxidase superfamily flavin-nucleotide-binding protein